MNTKKFLNLKGHFLIAMPGLLHPDFRQSVICIIEHTEKGSMGIIVNKVHPSLSAQAIFKQLKLNYVAGVASVPIYLGGPAHIEQIFVVHNEPMEWKKSLPVTPWLGMSNTSDILEDIAIGREPDSFIVSLGCVVWKAGQIEVEIKENIWLTCPVSKDVIFDMPVRAKWKGAVKKLGISPEFLSQAVGHA
jgi:putative transcriptional regulator